MQNRFIGLFLFCFLGQIHAQSDSGIKGYVLDAENDQSLPGARLYPVNDKSHGTLSQSDGSYRLNLPEGEYQIVCKMIGMKADTVKLKVEASQYTQYDFVLGENTEDLKVMVVSAGRFEQSLEELTVSMEVIRPDLIENKNTTSIESALEQAPGLTILDQEPQIRGGSGFTFGVGSRVAIVIDDMPLLTGDAGRPEWGFIPVENLEQIEIIKGASSVLYGSSALSGVINIRTAFPRSEPMTKINFTTGVYNTPSDPETKWWSNAPIYTGVNFLHSRIIKKNLDLVVGGNFFYDHGYIGPPVIADSYTAVDSISNFTEKQLAKQRARINFNLRYRSEKVKGLNFGVNGNAMLAHSNFALAWLDDTVGIFRAYPGAIALQDQSIFNVDPFVEFYAKNGVRHALRTRFFYVDNEITNNQSNSSTVLFGEYQLSKKFEHVPDFNFTGGVVGSYTQSTAILYSGSGIPDNQVNNLAAYAQLDKKMWTVLNVSAGVRLEYFKMNERESVVRPVFRTGLSLKVAEGTTVRASYGQGFRFPTIAERFILTNTGTFGVFPNPDLEPETSANSEIGVKQGFKIGKFLGFLDVAAFHQDYHNTIEYLFGGWDPSIAPAGFKFVNTFDTRVRGLDISIMGITDTSKDFQVTIYGGYTYVVPVALAPDSIYAHAGNRPLSYNLTRYDTTNNILKYRFQHTGKIDIQFAYKKWSVGYSGRVYGPMKNIDLAFRELEELTHPFSQFVNTYFTRYYEANNGFKYIQDVRLAYKINKNMRVSMVVNNAANKLYSLRPMKIEAPRTSAVQFIYKF